MLASLGTIVLIRFFTEVLGVLPRAFNFIDVPLLAVLVVAAAAHPAPSDEAPRGGEPVPARRVPLPGAVRDSYASRTRLGSKSAPCWSSSTASSGRSSSTGASTASGRRALRSPLSRLLVALLFIQLAVVALIDIPRFIGSENPDEISGTFGENPYQLVFFLLVVSAVLAGIFTFEHRRAVARFAPALFLAVLGVIVLAQYRALLFTTALTISS